MPNLEELARGYADYLTAQSRQTGLSGGQLIRNFLDEQVAPRTISGLGGAVLGGLLAGPMGAALGGLLPFVQEATPSLKKDLWDPLAYAPLPMMAMVPKPARNLTIEEALPQLQAKIKDAMIPKIAALFKGGYAKVDREKVPQFLQEATDTVLGDLFMNPKIGEWVAKGEWDKEINTAVQTFYKNQIKLATGKDVPIESLISAEGAVGAAPKGIKATERTAGAGAGKGSSPIFQESVAPSSPHYAAAQLLNPHNPDVNIPAMLEQQGISLADVEKAFSPLDRVVLRRLIDKQSHSAIAKELGVGTSAVTDRVKKIVAGFTPAVSAAIRIGAPVDWKYAAASREEVRKLFPWPVFRRALIETELPGPYISALEDWYQNPITFENVTNRYRSGINRNRLNPDRLAGPNLKLALNRVVDRLLETTPKLPEASDPGPVPKNRVLLPEIE